MAWTTPERIGRMQFSPNGLLLATTNVEAIENDSEDTVRLWDVLTGQEVAHLVDITQVFALSFASERELVLIVEEGVRLWDSVSGDVRKVINKTSNGGVAVLRGKGVVLSTRDDGEVLVVDLPSGNVRHRMRPPAATESWYDELDASERHLAAVCRADRDEYKLLVLWDVERGKRLRTYDISAWDFGPVAVHPQGSLVAVQADKIRSFGMDNEEELEGFTPYKCAKVYDLRYAVDGRTLLVLCEKGIVKLDALSGNVLSTFKLPATINWTGGLIDPSGEKVAVEGVLREGLSESESEIEVLDLIDA